MSPIAPIKAVCFDIFGTLISYPSRLPNPYRHLIASEKVRSQKRLPILTRNVGIDVFADELGLSHLMPTIQRELMQRISCFKPFADVDEALSRIRGLGVKVAVCSNLAQPYGNLVRQFLPEMDAYVLSYEVGFVKPDPQIYRLVCDTLELSPQEILFIGDSKRCDVRGPEAFGMNARWLDRGNGNTLLDVISTDLGLIFAQHKHS